MRRSPRRLAVLKSRHSLLPETFAACEHQPTDAGDGVEFDPGVLRERYSFSQGQCGMIATTAWMHSMTRFQRSCLQLVLALAAFATFAGWAPWLGTKPLSELAEIRPQHTEVPAAARGFSINHGEITFHRHGQIKDQPALFALHTFGLVVLIGAMLWLALDRK
jgi:hypothetical protein